MKLPLQRFYHQLFKPKIIKSSYSNIANLLQKKNVFIITVSEYSQFAIKYFFPNIANTIKILSPPPKRVMHDNINAEKICNEQLSEVIFSNKKFFYY